MCAKEIRTLLAVNAIYKLKNERSTPLFNAKHINTQSYSEWCMQVSMDKHFLCFSRNIRVCWKEKVNACARIISKHAPLATHRCPTDQITVSHYSIAVPIAGLHISFAFHIFETTDSFIVTVKFNTWSTFFWGGNIFLENIILIDILHEFQLDPFLKSIFTFLKKKLEKII